MGQKKPQDPVSRKLGILKPKSRSARLIMAFVEIVVVGFMLIVVSESITININPQKHAARFDGHGGVSGGGGGTRYVCRSTSLVDKR